MHLTLSQDELRPIVRSVVSEVIERFEADRAKFNGRLAYSEAEAAALLGVKRHVLRDLRLRGEISARKVGKAYRYSRQSLVGFMEVVQ